MADCEQTIAERCMLIRAGALMADLKCSICGARDKGIVVDAFIHQPGYSAKGFKAPG